MKAHMLAVMLASVVTTVTISLIITEKTLLRPSSARGGDANNNQMVLV